MPEVRDNFGAPFAGLSVLQDLASPFTPVKTLNAHADTTPENQITWLSPDAQGTTDANGRIDDFDLVVQSPSTEAQARDEDSPHMMKRVFVVARPVVKILYWNAYPVCSGQHVNYYPTLPPP